MPGLSGLRPLPGDIGRKIADLIWNLKVPVGAVWKLLPWNGGPFDGRPPTCSIQVEYVDEQMRISRDAAGAVFVYTRPLELME